MKKIKSYQDKLNADLVTQLLISNEINAVVIGAKNYTSHLMGSGLGQFDILVDSDQYDQAIELINKITLENKIIVEPVIQNSRVYLSKAVMFSVMAAILIPVVFNYAALRNLRLYYIFTPPSMKKYIFVILVLALQIPVIFYVYLLSHWFVMFISNS